MRPLDPRLVRRAHGVRGLLALSVGLGLATALATIGQAVLLASILAEVIIGGAALAEVTGQFLGLAAVIAGRAAVAWASEELARRSATTVIVGLRRELLTHAAALGPRWRSHAHGGELAVLAGTGLDSLHDYLSRYLPQVVLAGLIPVTMLAYLATEDLTSAIIVAITVPMIPVFMALVGWYTDRQTRSKWRALTRLAGHFTDVVAGLPTLKVFGRAQAQAAAVRKITDRYRRATMGTLRVAFLSSMVLELLASLSVALVAVSVGLRLVSGHLTLQVGLTVLILAPEAYLPLRALGTQFHAAADGVAAAEQALAVLDVPVPAAGRRSDLPPLPGWRLAGVTAGGPNPGDRGRVGPWDLHIRAGAVTVVTGPSGSGKTTLLHLLAGVLVPSSGHIMVTGADQEIPLPDVAPDRWRDTIAWCGQRPVLRAGTIGDNLESSGATPAELRQALTDAAADFVYQLPAGLDTRLGQDGVGLSQGQRQRICLARALLRSRIAPVVLLDEPTAALDDQSELQVLTGLTRALAGRTVVLVTHRQAPRAIADQLVDLPGGLGTGLADRAAADMLAGLGT